MKISFYVLYGSLKLEKKIPNFESILENLSGEANDLSKERSYAK